MLSLTLGKVEWSLAMYMEFQSHYWGYSKPMVLGMYSMRFPPVAFLGRQFLAIPAPSSHSALEVQVAIEEYCSHSHGRKKLAGRSKA